MAYWLGELRPEDAAADVPLFASEPGDAGGVHDPDPVERTHALLEDARRRDVDAVMSFYAPDCTWDSPPLGTRF